MIRKTAILPAAVLLLLQACTLVPPAREIVLYQMPESRLTEQPQSLDLTLKIMAVDGSDALNSRRILITADGASLHALPGARWASPARTLLRDRLVESMRRDNRIATITSDATALHSDLELHGTLREFAADISSGATARIRLDATLTDPQQRRVVAAREFAIEIPAGSDAAEALVAAFAEGTDQLAVELVNWIGSEASKP